MTSDDSPSIALAIFVHLALLSVMAIGGGVISLAPEIHRYMVDSNQWMSDQTFIESYTIAQIAPGPNMMFVTLLGYHAAGFLGALSATVAVILPPALLTLTVLRFGTRHAASPAAIRFKTVLVPIAVGMMIATGWSLSRMAIVSAGGLALAFMTTLLLLQTKFRINPLWMIAFGGFCGAMEWV